MKKTRSDTQKLKLVAIISFVLLLCTIICLSTNVLDFLDQGNLILACVIAIIVFIVLIASSLFFSMAIGALIQHMSTKKSYQRSLNMIKEKLSFEFSEVRLKNPDECTLVTCIPNKDIEVVAKLDEDNNIVFQFQIDAEIITDEYEWFLNNFEV